MPEMHKIKTLHLVLGSLAFLALSCAALYFFTINPPKTNEQATSSTEVTISKEITNKPIEASEENKIAEEHIEENKTIKRTIKTPLVMMGINIQSVDQNSKSPVIEAAFGFTMGDIFDDTNAIAKFQLSSGTFLYEIKPILPYEGIGRYYITTNTHDKTIDSIRGIESFSNAEEAHKEIEVLSKLVTQKYNLIQTEDNFKYYKDGHGNLLLLFLKEISENEYEVHLHCLCPN